jgi:hypothetical protein
VAADYFDGLKAFTAAASADPARRTVEGFVVYGGGETQRRSSAAVVPWSELNLCRWWEEGD